MSTRSHFDHTASKSIAAQGVRAAHNINDQTRLARRLAPGIAYNRLPQARARYHLSEGRVERGARGIGKALRFRCPDQRSADLLPCLLGYHPGYFRLESSARGCCIKGAFARRAKAEGSSVTNGIPKRKLVEVLAGNFRQDLLNENPRT